MIAFDTDVLTEILLGNTLFVKRAAAIPEGEQGVPVIAIEELLRGRLNAIRQAEASRANVGIARAYELFGETFSDCRRLRILSYTPRADALYQRWRQQGIRLSTHDPRIAATCVTHDAQLVSRNRRDFERAPGLRVEFWE